MRACVFACIACLHAVRGVQCTFAAVLLKLESNGATIAVLHRVSAQKAASVCSDRRPPWPLRSPFGARNGSFALWLMPRPRNIRRLVQVGPAKQPRRPVLDPRRIGRHEAVRPRAAVDAVEGHGSFPFLLSLRRPARWPGHGFELSSTLKTLQRAPNEASHPQQVEGNAQTRFRTGITQHKGKWLIV